MSKNSSVKTTVREVYDLTIEDNGVGIYIEITGNGFLYNMVRIIIGTLLDVGYGKITPEKIKEIIDSRQRKNAGKMVPSQGLQLLSVEY